MLPKNNPTETQAWQKLRDHFYEIQFVKMQELFCENKIVFRNSIFFGTIFNRFLKTESQKNIRIIS